jgi:hypothetical protein
VSRALSERARRHFPDEPTPALAEAGGRSRALAVLLEHGDRRDLAELFAALPAGAAHDWVARHGARRLSRRSRAFWWALLAGPDAAPPPASAAARELWPLA